MDADVNLLGAEPLLGNPAKGVVILRFPSEQAVRDFDNDPDYRPVKEVRLALTTPFAGLPRSGSEPTK